MIILLREASVSGRIDGPGPPHLHPSGEGASFVGRRVRGVSDTFCVPRYLISGECGWLPRNASKSCMQTLKRSSPSYRPRLVRPECFPYSRYCVCHTRTGVAMPRRGIGATKEQRSHRGWTDSIPHKHPNLSRQPAGTICINAQSELPRVIWSCICAAISCRACQSTSLGWY